MFYPKSINDLIESFKTLPSIGEKTAERLALFVLEMDKEKAEIFSKNIIDVKIKIIKCKLCNNLSEKEICDICSDNTRDKKTLCVTEDVKNIIVFEKLNIYNGRYFIINNLISPIDGIGPDDIGLDKLIDLIETNETNEVILTFKPSMDSEVTSLYISKILKEKNVKVTKLAHGIPMNAELSYLDNITLENAFNYRNKIE